MRSGILHHSPWGKVPWRMKEMEFAIPTVCSRTSHDGSGLMMLRLGTWWDHKCIWPYLGLKCNIKPLYLSGCRRKKKHGSSEHYFFPTALGFVCCSCAKLSIIFCNYRSPAICFCFHDQFMLSVSQSTFTTYCFLDCDHLVCVDTLRVAPFRLFFFLLPVMANEDFVGCLVKWIRWSTFSSNNNSTIDLKEKRFQPSTLLECKCTLFASL